METSTSYSACRHNEQIGTVWVFYTSICLFYIGYSCHILSKQLIQLPRQQCCSPRTIQNIFFSFFLWNRDWCNNLKASFLKEDVCCPLWVGKRWWKPTQPTSQGEQRCLPSPIVSDWYRRFFPPASINPALITPIPLIFDILHRGFIYKLE